MTFAGLPLADRNGFCKSCSGVGRDQDPRCGLEAFDHDGMRAQCGAEACIRWGEPYDNQRR